MHKKFVSELTSILYTTYIATFLQVPIELNIVIFIIKDRLDVLFSVIDVGLDFMLIYSEQNSLFVKFIAMHSQVNIRINTYVHIASVDVILTFIS
jgi:hypothetical protein